MQFCSCTGFINCHLLFLCEFPFHVPWEKECGVKQRGLGLPGGLSIPSPNSQKSMVWGIWWEEKEKDKIKQFCWNTSVSQFQYKLCCKISMIITWISEDAMGSCRKQIKGPPPFEVRIKWANHHQTSPEALPERWVLLSLPPVLLGIAAENTPKNLVSKNAERLRV